MINPPQRKLLLTMAHEAIKAGLDDENYVPARPVDDVLADKYGVFVSLHLEGKLRGCIGYVRPHKSLYISVVEMAVAAAFDDPRFAPLTSSELSHLHIEISVLSAMVEVHTAADIVLGRDGLYLKSPISTGLLLPQVPIEWNWDKDEFLVQICRKAGLSHSLLWALDTQLFRFSAQIFSE